MLIGGLDPAVKRRFQDKILLSLPEFDERKLMFKILDFNTIIIILRKRMFPSKNYNISILCNKYIS